MTPKRKAGRRAIDGATGVVQVSVALTAEQREILRQLGGSVWVRARIEETRRK
jgi:hypothetical protein